MKGAGKGCDVTTGSIKLSANDKPHTFTTISNVFPYTQVAREIGEAQGWDEPAILALTVRMLEAITSQPPQLLTRGSRTGLPNRQPSDVVLHLVHPDDVNEWLKGQGLGYRWVSPKALLAPVAGGFGPSTPWLTIDTRDPVPVQPWYTPARYFARQLVKGDSTLLLKRGLLAEKVSQSLAAVGIYKRGGRKSPNSTTVLKAFSNVTLG